LFHARCVRVSSRACVVRLSRLGQLLRDTRTAGSYDCAHDTPEIRAYEQLVLCHLEDLYTKYGNFFELWNDGGAPCRPQFEAQVAALTAKHQPDVLVFQGPTSWPNDVRWVRTEACTPPLHHHLHACTHARRPPGTPCMMMWQVGTEAGTAPLDTWSSSADSQGFGAGSRDGARFVPAEADTCIRTATCGSSGSGGCWVWCPNTTLSVKSLATLQQNWRTTVGRNTNYLLNISPNVDGTIDDADMVAYEGLGRWVEHVFGRNKGDGTRTRGAGWLAERTLVSGDALKAGGTGVELTWSHTADALPLRYVSIMEDQHLGQVIWSYEVR
jgi:hypothetical protein